MAKKHVASPSEGGRTAQGRIRAVVRPGLKIEADAIAQADTRIRSLSHLVEMAMELFVSQYKEANGELDRDGRPVIGPARTALERRAASPPDRRTGTNHP